MRFGADFSALINRFSSNSDQPIALAVSGGSDSIALLSFAHEWAESAGRRLVVFTVDHGLRPDAKLEAAAVSQYCHTLSVPHRTLVWTDPKPTQSAARAARYRLLANAARDAGAVCVLTGHTLDDVVETALMRRRRGVRGSVVAGPAIASPLPTWPLGRGLTLLRPLLTARRRALRDHLESGNVNWLEDPSNDNLSFERVRLRKFVQRQQRLAEIALKHCKLMQTDRTREDAAFGLNLARVHVNPDGLIDTHQATLSPRLLSILARCASGSDRDPRGGSVNMMLSNLNTVGQRQTLGGAWFQRSNSGYLVGRDPALVDEQTDYDMFDGRFVRDDAENLPAPEAAGFLVRHALPQGQGWREIISERIWHIAHCVQTPFYDCLIE